MAAHKYRNNRKPHKQSDPKDLSVRPPGSWFIWKFILLYIGLMGIFLILIGLPAIQTVFDINSGYTQMIIWLSAAALEPFGVVKGTSGSIIALSGINLDVRFGCNGLEAFLIYLAAIIAFPSRVGMKLVGVIAGFAILQFLNVLRIAGLGLSGVYLKEYFHIIHIYVAQGIMIVFALIIFLVWLHYASEK